MEANAPAVPVAEVARVRDCLVEGFDGDVGCLVGKALRDFPLFTVSCEEVQLKPPAAQLRALNGQIYDERACCNGEDCISRAVDGFPGCILQECLAPEDWQYLQKEGMHRVPVQQCVLCRRLQISTYITEFVQYPGDEALMFVQDYRNACVPGDRECYRESACFTPKHFACLSSPVVRFQLGDYCWRHHNGVWRVDQSRLLQLPRAITTREERNECVATPMRCESR